MKTHLQEDVTRLQEEKKDLQNVNSRLLKDKDRLREMLQAAMFNPIECPVKNPKVKRIIRDDYIYTEGFGSYKIYWTDAREACIKDGSHLATIDSKEEMDESFRMSSITYHGSVVI